MVSDALIVDAQLYATVQHETLNSDLPPAGHMKLSFPEGNPRSKIIGELELVMRYNANIQHS